MPIPRFFRKRRLRTRSVSAMGMRWLVGWLLLAGMCATAPSCRLLDTADDIDLDAASPLRPVTPSIDSVAVEIFIARMPSDKSLHQALWRRIDEQAIEIDVRRELARNGFRVGVLGGFIPDEIAHVLRIEEARLTPNSPPVDGSTNEGDAAPVDLAGDGAVTRQWRRLRPGQHAEVNVSDVRARMPVLINDDDGLHGETFSNAQAVFVLRVEHAPRGQTRLKLSPELHTGSPKTRYTSGEGPFWKVEVGRDRQVFEKLQISSQLSPGQMLVVGCDDASAGSLGEQFHQIGADKGGGRRLVVIRLAESAESESAL